MHLIQLLQWKHTLMSLQLFLSVSLFRHVPGDIPAAWS